MSGPDGLARPGRRALPALAVATLLAALPWAASGAPGGAGVAVPAAERLAGPFRLGDLFLLGVGYLGYAPPPARLLAPGRWQLDVSLASGNTFSRSESVLVALDTRGVRAPVDRAFFERVEETKLRDDTLFLLDGEVSQAALRLRRGLPRAWEVEVTVPWVEVGGGILDRPAEGFHSTLGLDLDGRRRVPRGGYLIYLGDPRHEVWRSEPPGGGLGDVRLAVRKRLALGAGRYAVVVDGGVKLPTGGEDDLTSSGSADLAVQALFSRCAGRHCWHLGAGLRRLGAWEALSIPARTLAGGLFGYERAVGERLSVAGHLLVAQSPWSGTPYGTLQDESFQLTAGARYRAGPRRVLWFGLVENVVHFENGADIALHVGLEQALGGSR